MSGLNQADRESLLQLLIAEYGGEREDWTAMRSLAHFTNLVEAIVARAVNEALTEAAEAIEEARSSHVYLCRCTECRISDRAARIVRARTTN